MQSLFKLMYFMLKN